MTISRRWGCVGQLVTIDKQTERSIEGCVFDGNDGVLGDCAMTAMANDCYRHCWCGGCATSEGEQVIQALATSAAKPQLGSHRCRQFPPSTLDEVVLCHRFPVSLGQCGQNVHVSVQVSP